MTRKEALEYVNNMWMYEDTKNALETLIPEFGKTGSDKVIDYEEKYNEALERAKKFEEKYGGGYAEYIFPELAESEDERILRVISEAVITFFSDYANDFEDEDRDAALAWLENQKENPKSADSIQSNCTSDAKCEDRDSNYGVFPEDVIVVARACEKLKAHGYTELAHALKNVNLYTKEQKPVDYDHEMWKNCEANFEGGKKDVIDHPEKYGLQKPAWSEEDVKRLYSIGTQIGFLKGKYSEYQKDIDWLYALAEKMGFHKCKIGEVVTEWKKENIDDKMLSKPKQEWSKEETKDLVHILKVLDDCYIYGTHDLSKTDYDNLTSTLKSLRPSWKPSEVQMSALLAVLNDPDNIGAESCQLALNSLYDDLKKLKEE